MVKLRPSTERVVVNSLAKYTPQPVHLIASRHSEHLSLHSGVVLLLAQHHLSMTHSPDPLQLCRCRSSGSLHFTAFRSCKFMGRYEDYFTPLLAAAPLLCTEVTLMFPPA
ncbi:hypothetical protein E2C01_045229 [Portunus trituberculatus]|uniref:Uncharacterized protein n=1 Tax=Portunus trituberculatus TaxID=210409 RepID=A0A5B7G1F1_PORTR|nr:hypothetical protein [Portunus trituberculatus]